MAKPSTTDLAYAAGQAVLSEPAERRSLDACPFEEGTDERSAWLRGYADALDAVPSADDIRKELDND